MYKRVNNDFRIDNMLMRTYDNRDKFIPFSRVDVPLNNELLILRANDPVRNYKTKSLYFFDCLERDFINNHDFSAPKLTYLYERPFYSIGFSDNQHFRQGVNSISAEGTIFIDAVNYGIKKIHYRATIDNGTNRQKLFELNLEYSLQDEKYLLHYLSFNNLFYTRNFKLIRMDLIEDKLELSFNKAVHHEEARDPGKYIILFQEQEQEIKEIIHDRRKVIITFDENSLLAKSLEIDQMNPTFRNTKKLNKNAALLRDSLQVEFNDLTDYEGYTMSKREFNEYYQYREFFTNHIYPEHKGISANLIDKSIPVIENQIFGAYTGDTSWLNTPLITEDLGSSITYSNNEKLNSHLESLFKNSDRKLNEMVYLHTDREVYAPEDTLWFKAYIRNKALLTPSALSQTFVIQLVGSDGKVISNETCLIMDSGVRGQMILEHTLSEGIYYLVGYSSWMKNFGAETLFSKKIVIRKDRRDGYQLVVAYDKPGYFPGDTMKYTVHCYDVMDKEIDDVSFNYKFVTGKKTHQAGRGNTSTSWLEPMIFIIPPDPDTIPAIEFRCGYKGQNLDIIYSLPVNYSVHVDFLPEGGHCFNGIKTNMAFKAVTSHGKPVGIEGNILDQEGNLLTSIKSQHDGMGVFTYKPEENKHYFLQLIRPAGLSGTFHLPEGRNQGWQTSAKTSGKNIHLEIRTVNVPNDTVLITMKVRDYLCYYKVIKTGRRKLVEINTAQLPRGIAVITLFDSELLPRAERLLYIGSPDQDVSLATDRQRYIPRDSVLLQISLNSNEPSLTNGSFSLSVIDEQLCSTDLLDEPDIRTSFLLSPEIKGEIFQPDQYLADKNNEAMEDLDLLLMTQGWRNYRYLDELERQNLTDEPENGDIFSGRLMEHPFGRDMRPATGNLVIYYGGNSTRVPVDEDGRFSILPDYDPATNSGLIFTATDEKGNDKLSIIFDSTLFEREFPGYLANLADSLGKKPVQPIITHTNIQDHFSLGLENHQWIEEVVIRAEKRQDKTFEELMIEDFISFNKSVARREEIDISVELYDVLLNMGKPIELPDLIDPEAPLLHLYNPRSEIGWIIDDIYYGTPYSMVSHISPNEIDKLYFIKGPETQYFGMFMPEVIVSLKLRRYDPADNQGYYYNKHVVEKFMIAKEFYQPVYDTEEKRINSVPDLRKTIHWEPELQFNEDGTATIRFYNGDRYTRIKCILEGITDDGIPVHAEHFYDVTLTRGE